MPATGAHEPGQPLEAETVRAEFRARSGHGVHDSVDVGKVGRPGRLRIRDGDELRSGERQGRTERGVTEDDPPAG